MVDTYQPPVMPAPAVSPERMVWAYAGFWWRVLAWGIDWFILAVAQTLINLATGLTPFGITSTTTSTGRDISNVVDIRIAYADSAVIAPVQWTPPHMHVHGLPLTLISILVMAAYFVLLESSRWQGTLGKKVCRLRVTDTHGRRISIARAIGRYLGKYVSAFILGIGFLMVAWTRRKQGLHDLMADTLVMRLRPADTLFAFQDPAS